MLPPTFFACCCVYCGRLSASPALFHLLPWQFSILIFESFLKYTAHRSQLREMRAKFGEIVLRFQGLPQICLLRVGVLISKLHSCTRCRKSSFTERSFIVAWLIVQFPKVPKVRVNILIFSPTCLSIVPLIGSIGSIHCFENPDIQAHLWMQGTEFWNEFCVFNLGRPRIGTGLTWKALIHNNPVVYLVKHHVL